MEPGLYVTFFNSDEPAGRELPAVGPLYNVVLRHKSLVAERRMVMQAQELGVAIDRWLEAELEMQRATGDEPGGTKRSEKRISARDGVFLRFAVFGDAHEPDIAPELGPFAAVVVGTRSVEADGRTLATRPASDLAPWELASGAGEELDGKHKPDIAFRTANTSYHPSISAFVPGLPAAARAVAPAAPSAPSVAPAVPPVVSAPRSMPSEPAFAIPPRSEPVFSPAASAEPFFTPAPRTEQVITPRTEQVIRPATPTEQFIRPTPRTEQVIRTGPRPDSPPASSSENGPLFQERPRRETEVYSARGDASAPAGEDKLTPGDVELIARIDRERSDETLRARIHEGERRRLGIDEQTKEDASSVSMRYRAQAAPEPDYVGESRFEWGPALWRMRFAIIGVLVLLVGAYAFIVLRTGGAPTLGGPQAQGTRVANIGTRFTAPGWEFVADGVTRVDAAGNVRARGVFLIVRVTASNKALVDSQLGLGSFTLIDPRGARYAPETISSGVHQGGPSAGSAYALGSDLVSGRTVALTLVFDVDPSVTRGLILQITEAPNVTLKLD